MVVWQAVTQWLRLVGLAALFCLSQNSAQADSDEVLFGLVPALSPEAMIRRFQPLATHLEKELGVRVRLEGAPDFETYMTRVLDEARYDMIITGGDFFRLAERRAGYHAIVRVRGDGVTALLIAAKDNGFSTLDDLPGNPRVASIGELSMMHRLGTKTLGEHGIVIGENATLFTTPSFNGAILSLLADQADVAIIAAPFFNNVDKDIRDRIAILDRSELAPHHPFSVSRNVPDKLRARLTATMLRLPETESGAAALAAMSFPGLVAVEPGLYEAMDWAADELERELGIKSD